MNLCYLDVSYNRNIESSQFTTLPKTLRRLNAMETLISYDFFEHIPKNLLFVDLTATLASYVIYSKMY